MKQIVVLLLTIYQKAVSPALHVLLGVNNMCRYEITCSNYAKQKIQKEGVFKGSVLSFARILKCQPFYKV